MVTRPKQIILSPWYSWFTYLPIDWGCGFYPCRCFAYNHICWMVLITLNGGYTGSLKLVVIRWIMIGLGSDISNKDQTYPYSVVAKKTCVICNCTNQSSPPIRVAQVCCGAQVQIWHSVAWGIRMWSVGSSPMHGPNPAVLLHDASGGRFDSLYPTIVDN